MKGKKRMVMWKFKKCPRCMGDIFIDRDMDGWYEQCLQCSYRRDLVSEAEFKEPMVSERKTHHKKRSISSEQP